MNPSSPKVPGSAGVSPALFGGMENSRRDAGAPREEIGDDVEVVLTIGHDYCEATSPGSDLGAMTMMVPLTAW
jgi:hypothetical protein